MHSDNRRGEFLRARRELARPADFGLPEPTRRRTPGLRRQEVALLAGVSAGRMLVVYHAEPGSPSEQALALLGSMTAETTPASSRPVTSQNRFAGA
jgi:hypothetical protein